MTDLKIRPMQPEEYEKCANIWDMQSNPAQTEKWRQQILCGNRMVWVVLLNGDFVGEGALVKDNQDADYTIPGQRVCLSRLIIKEEYRGQGIGGALVDVLLCQARHLGYTQASIGVDKSNTVALGLYRKKGFSQIIFDGEDEAGPYYKLLQNL